MPKIILSAFAVLAMLGLSGCHTPITGVLNPKGVITYQERQLLFDSLALMLIVVIPVIIMSFAFVFRYRAAHKKVQHSYKPNWSHSFLLESIWWGVPCLIIIVLGILTWKKTHSLDPYRKIPGTVGKPLLVQAVALPWKWLFIYPKQGIATINSLVIPKGKQVQFWLTSDNVPMSAFFIPQLGSQIYTMAGMRTRLHIIATQDGTFQGLNAQYNGDGFSDMHFETHVVEPKAFDVWVSKVKSSGSALSASAFQKVRKPSIKAPPKLFSSFEPNLFKKIIMSYKMPRKTEHSD